MSNITLAIDDDLLAVSRAYADRHHLSLNALIRTLLEQRVRSTSADWVDDCFARMDLAAGDSGGRTWSRMKDDATDG
jgi:hypothetical protein